MKIRIFLYRIFPIILWLSAVIRILVLVRNNLTQEWDLRLSDPIIIGSLFNFSIAFCNYCNENVLNDTKEKLNINTDLPNTHEYKAVHIYASYEKSWKCQLSVHLCNIISMHQRKKSIHCLRRWTESFWFPKYTDTQKYKTYKEWEDSYHSSNNYWKCNCKSSIDKSIVWRIFYISGKWNPAEHTPES